MTKNTRKALEHSIFWQEYVLKNSKDPVQKERVKAAIEKLRKELEEATE